MLTRQRQRNNNSTYFQMTSVTNKSQKVKSVQKLAGSINASIKQLEQLKVKLLAQTQIKSMAKMLKQYDNKNIQFNNLLNNLGQLDQNLPMIKQIKQRAKNFLQSNQIDDIRMKLDSMKRQKNKAINSQPTQSGFSQGLQGQLLNKHGIRYKMLLQQKQQLQQIQKLIYTIQDIANKTSIMINAQGQNIELSLDRMKKAKTNFQQGRKNMVQANQFQQDTNKKKLAFCFLIVIFISIVLMVMYSSRK